MIIFHFRTLIDVLSKLPIFLPDYSTDMEKVLETH